MPLTPEELEILEGDDDDQSLDDLLQSIPRPLERRVSSSSGPHPLTVSPKNSSASPQSSAPTFSSTANKPLSPLVSLEERAHLAEPLHRTYAEFGDVKDVSLLGWYTERRRERVKESFRYKIVKYLPCRICPKGSTEYMALNDSALDDRKIVVQFLGKHVEFAGKLNCIKRSQFVPFDSEPSCSSDHKRKQGSAKAGHDSNEESSPCSLVHDGDASTQDADHHVAEHESNHASSVPSSQTDSSVSSAVDPQAYEQLSSGTTTEGWSEAIIQIYRQVLRHSKRPADLVMKAKPGFWNREYRTQYTDEQSAWFDYWFRIEQNFLQNVYWQVQQQEQDQSHAALHASLKGKVHGDDSEGETDEAEEKIQPVQPEGEPSLLPVADSRARLSQEVDEDDDSETTSFVRKLRAGDEIEYFPSVSVASRRNARVARIFCVHGKKKSDLCLEMDNRQFVEVSAMVSLRRRYIRGKLLRVDEKKSMAVECFNLDSSMNGHVDFLRQDLVNIFSGNIVEEAWQASADQDANDADPPVMQHAKTEVVSAHATNNTTDNSATVLSGTLPVTAQEARENKVRPNCAQGRQVNRDSLAMRPSSSVSRASGSAKRPLPKDDTPVPERRRSLRKRTPKKL